jgi:glycosyltransferase involved in cell wall biosynthesis
MLVLPSLQSETWGLVINDALHHGLPCIVSEAVGCAPDLVETGVTGRVFSTGTVSDLATSIAQMLPLTNRADVREKCREKVAGYTVEKAAEGIARAFSGVVPSSAPVVHCA